MNCGEAYAVLYGVEEAEPNWHSGFMHHIFCWWCTSQFRQLNTRLKGWLITNVIEEVDESLSLARPKNGCISAMSTERGTRALRMVDLVTL